MKTSELTGDALDWAVAQCEGLNVDFDEDFGWIELSPSGECHTPMRSYSTSWAHGGPIIERERVAIFSVEAAPFKEQWAADIYPRQQPKSDDMGDEHYAFYLTSMYYGPTPLIAAMRAYVASKFGAEIKLPQELK